MKTGVDNFRAYMASTMACEEMLYKHFPSDAPQISHDLELVWVWGSLNKYQIIDKYK